MMEAETLHAAFARSARATPEAIAVEDPSRATITYGALDRLSDRVRDRLHARGVLPGDRVGIYMRKSIDAIACILGTLKSGAIYVPVDPDAPPPRCAYILDDCAVRVVFTERRLEPTLCVELARLGGSVAPTLLAYDSEDDGVIPLVGLLDREDRTLDAPAVETVHPAPDAVAYILYTSGSTGRPKGVMLSHRAGTSFVDWCSAVFEPSAADRFSSHAPLHFDLSILDVFVSLKHGARLVLIDEEVGREPHTLAPLIAEARISVWYSTPSILSMLARYGRLERYDFGALRLVLFAGEVFPVPQFRAIQTLWPTPRYFNLYGPTETNVCTYYEVAGIVPADRTAPFPIGRTCEHLRSMVVDLDERPVSRGEEGELVVSGPGVMDGYWNLPERNALAFLVDRSGERWYRTGDLVRESEDGSYIFHGRRDRMVKRRGYRVELGEIEAGLADHPAAREVAVVALPLPDAGVRIKAFLSLNDGPPPSIIDLKQFCMKRLPKYMVPDTFGFVDALPRTSTDKIDYQSLKDLS